MGLDVPEGAPDDPLGHQQVRTDAGQGAVEPTDRSRYRRVSVVVGGPLPANDRRVDLAGPNNGETPVTSRSVKRLPSGNHRANATDAPYQPFRSQGAESLGGCRDGDVPVCGDLPG